MINRICRNALALSVSLFFVGQTISAQEQHAPRVQETKSRAAGAPRLTATHMLLFGSIPVSTRSLEARKAAELALDKYEAVMLDDAIVHAQHATELDHNFAFGYAMLSFASRRAVPNHSALARAKALMPLASPDEQLLVKWMTGLQERNLLPAIASMNDLLKRYPRNKHILYLTSEWLYFQEDFDRSQKMMESLRELDPNYPPVLNMLGYSYIESGRPDPTKAVAALKHYAEVETGSPNPEDSLGEVLRYAGRDEESLEHYGAALQVDPTFFSSQLGLGDTLTLMGKFDEARQEYEKAALVSENHRDLLHASYQRALTFFWEGRAEEGRAALATLAAEAAEKKEPNAQFEIGLGAAMLAPDYSSELRQLQTLEASFKDHTEGMSGSDRGGALANILCEEARVAAQHGDHDTAEQAITKLAQFAAQSGDLRVGNYYETARGFLLLSQGDLSNAADELSSNRRSPLAVQQLAAAQQESGDRAAAAETLLALKYQRAPTVEWYIASQSGGFKR